MPHSSFQFSLTVSFGHRLLVSFFLPYLLYFETVSRIPGWLQVSIANKRLRTSDPSGSTSQVPRLMLWNHLILSESESPTLTREVNLDQILLSLVQAWVSEDAVHHCFREKLETDTHGDIIFAKKRESPHQRRWQIICLNAKHVFLLMSFYWP